MRGVLIVLVGFAVIALGVAAYVYSTFDDQTPADVAELIEEFRATRGADRTGPGVPPQGVYRYTLTGREEISRGPISVTRTLPTEAASIVRHSAAGFDVDTRYSGEHVDVDRYAVRPDGTYATRTATTIRVGPISSTQARDWKPHLLRFPTARTRWGGVYMSGDLRVVIRARVRPSESVTVGGTRVRARVFAFMQTVTGEYRGIRSETFWISDGGVILRYRVRSSFRGPTDVDFDADLTLASLQRDV